MQACKVKKEKEKKKKKIGHVGALPHAAAWGGRRIRVGAAPLRDQHDTPPPALACMLLLLQGARPARAPGLHAAIVARRTLWISTKLTLIVKSVLVSCSTRVNSSSMTFGMTPWLLFSSSGDQADPMVYVLPDPVWPACTSSSSHAQQHPAQQSAQD